MAHNSYIRGSVAAWATASVVTDSEFWALDQSQFKSINGDDGGTWAPTATITIGGAGLTIGSTLASSGASLSGTWGGSPVLSGSPTFSGNPIFSSAVAFTGTPTISGTLASSSGGISGSWSGNATWTGNHTFNGYVTLGSSVTSSGATLYGTFGGNPAFSGNPVFSGTPTVSGALTSSGGTLVGTWGGSPILSGSPTFSGNPTFSSAVAFTGGMTISDPVILSGDGRIRRRVVQCADADTSYAPADGDLFVAPALTTNRTYSFTAANDGDTIRVVKRQGSSFYCQLSFPLGVYYPDGVPYSTLRNNGTSGDVWAMEATYSSGLSAWVVTRADVVP